MSDLISESIYGIISAAVLRHIVESQKISWESSIKKLQFCRLPREFASTSS